MITFDVTVRLSDGQEHRAADILAQLHRRDRRLFVELDHNTIINKWFMTFSTHRETVADRLEKNLRAAVRAVRVRAEVDSFAVIS